MAGDEVTEPDTDPREMAALRAVLASYAEQIAIAYWQLRQAEQALADARTEIRELRRWLPEVKRA